MKVIEVKSHVYECLKAFRFEGRDIEPGQRIKLPDDVGFSLASVGKAFPCGIPSVAKYKAIRAFDFQVGDKIIKVKSGELLEIKKQDAFQLMLKRYILPLDADKVWCPYKEIKGKESFIDSLKIGEKEFKILAKEPQRPKKGFILGWKKEE
jgi:hypothetical protein